MKIDELMELHQKATPGEWIGVPYNSDHGVVVNIQGEDRGIGHINTYNQKPHDADLIVAIHNSFPDLYREYKVMELMIRSMAGTISGEFSINIDELINDEREAAESELKEVSGDGK